MGRSHGMTISDPLQVIDYNAWNKPQPKIVAEFRNMFRDLKTKYKQLDLIVAAFQGTNVAYNVLKTCGDLEFGIPTQAVDSKNVYKNNEQTVSNILLKINTKLGGKNFIFDRSNELYGLIMFRMGFYNWHTRKLITTHK